ncbi:MAG: hypothetical protein IJY02_05325 [Oscillospiraceae bacterium]|nr:hypothetical protein [Oscillospiraceae bacterium]
MIYLTKKQPLVKGAICMRYGYDPVWTIFLNNFVVFVLPFLCGLLLRILLRKARLGWLVTVLFALLAVITMVIAVDPPVSGSEYYGIRVCQCLCATGGSLLVGMILKLKRRKRDRRKAG